MLIYYLSFISIANTIAGIWIKFLYKNIIICSWKQDRRFSNHRLENLLKYFIETCKAVEVGFGKSVFVSSCKSFGKTIEMCITLEVNFCNVRIFRTNGIRKYVLNFNKNISVSSTCGIQRIIIFRRGIWLAGGGWWRRFPRRFRGGRRESCGWSPLRGGG